MTEVASPSATMLFSFVDWLYSCVQYVQEVTLLYAITAKRPTNLLPRRFLLGASDSSRLSSLPITNHRELPPFITMHAHRFPARINEIIGMPKSHRKVFSHMSASLGREEANEESHRKD